MAISWGYLGKILGISWGPLVHLSICPLVHWSIGQLVPYDHWTIGPWDHWSIGPLDHWSIGPLVNYSINPLVHWSKSQFGLTFVGAYLRSSSGYFWDWYDLIFLAWTWRSSSRPPSVPFLICYSGISQSSWFFKCRVVVMSQRDLQPLSVLESVIVSFMIVKIVDLYWIDPVF